MEPDEGVVVTVVSSGPAPDAGGGRRPRREPGGGCGVTVVPRGPEADVVCGLLRSAGIDCAYRDTEAIESSLEEFTAAGPREILVRASDLDAARELLAGSTT